MKKQLAGRTHELAGRTLAILGFHKIGEPPSDGWETWFFIPETTFAEQLKFLQENDWQVIDREAFLRGLKAPEDLPERAALLTFDDGYRSMRTVALPWLIRFGYPAILFVPTDFIGGRNTFDAAEPEGAICDWDDLAELERWGVSVQSHGATHRPFSQLAPADLEEELHRSKAALEEGLGKRVDVFSYPYGDDGVSSYPYGDARANPQVLRQVQEALKRIGYRAACLYGGDANRLPGADPYRLTRLAMGPDTQLHAELLQAGPIGAS
jgi:peptidoglycan/xylan/chitin deacetylase (PgdA/CDA1 family)